MATDVNVLDLPYHEVTALFPMLRDAEKAAFKRSVETAGVLEPVVYWSDSHKRKWLIDGRNRVESVKELRAEGKLFNGAETYTCPAWEFKGSELEMLAYTLKKGRDRRHLNSSQRAAISVKAGALADKYDKKRVLSGSGATPDGDLAEKVALEAGTNRSYVFEAQKLALEAPDLLDQVAEGVLNIPQAKAELNRRKAAVKARPDQPVPPDGAADGEPARAPDQPADQPLPVVFDGLKNEVGPDWMHVFVCRDDFKKVLPKLTELKAMLEDLAAGDGGKFLDLTACLAQLKTLRGHVTKEMPHAICPACLGTKKEPGSKKKTCKSCGGHGYVSKTVYDAVLKVTGATPTAAADGAATADEPAGEPAPEPVGASAD